MLSIQISDTLFIPADRFGFRSQYRLGHEGIMWKRGHVIKNWKKRYFVLNNNLLKYYIDNTLRHLKGCFLIDESCTIERGIDGWEGRLNILILRNPTMELYLSIDSSSDMSKWYDAIQDTISHGLPSILQPELTWPKFRTECVVDVLYDGHLQVTDGNYLYAKNIRESPLVFISFRGTPEVSDRYLLLAFDLDYPSRKDRYRSHLLVWIVGNLHGTMESKKPQNNNSNHHHRLNKNGRKSTTVPSCIISSVSGEELVSYHPPQPAESGGLHRLFFVVFKQQRIIASDERYVQRLTTERSPFKMQDCMESLDLVRPVGIDGCYVQWDPSCSVPIIKRPELIPFPTIPSPPESQPMSPSSSSSSNNDDVDEAEEVPPSYGEIGRWSPSPPLRRKSNQPHTQLMMQRAGFDNKNTENNQWSADKGSIHNTPETPPDEVEEAIRALEAESDDPNTPPVVAMSALRLTFSDLSSPEPSPPKKHMETSFSDDHLLLGNASFGIFDELSSSRSSSVTLARQSDPSRAHQVSFSELPSVASPVRSYSTSSTPADAKLISALKRNQSKKKKTVSFSAIEPEKRVIDTYLPENVAFDLLDYQFEPPDLQYDFDASSISKSGVATQMRPIIRSQNATKVVLPIRSPPKPKIPKPHKEVHLNHTSEDIKMDDGQINNNVVIDAKPASLSEVVGEVGRESSQSTSSQASNTNESENIVPSVNISEEKTAEVVQINPTNQILLNSPVLKSLLQGGMLMKKFSSDFVFKQSFVWINPNLNALHWSKAGKGRSDEGKNKFVLFSPESKLKQLPRGECKGVVKTVVRDGAFVTLGLEAPNQTLRLKLDGVTEATAYETLFVNMLSH